MFTWAKQQMANVAGTQEPIYGPSAIRSVSEQAKTVPYSELSRDDMKWHVLDSTCVETQTFYFMTDSGYISFAQVIYSNVIGIRTTAQFNSKVSITDRSKPSIWCSTPLKNFEFSQDKTCFYGTDCAVELSEDGQTFTIKSTNDERSLINLKMTRVAPGFHCGQDGKTLYGTDLSNPWGFMRHAFWPRCVTEGTVATPDGVIDFKGHGLFVHALQGMKPHHAAAKWNFITFHSPSHSAVMMEYTTPPSYGSTVVNVGGIAKDNVIIVAGAQNEAKHIETQKDAETGWDAPTSASFTWRGTSPDGKPVYAVIEGHLEERMDRVDVMAEVPAFIKKLVAGAAGTKPFIFQYHPQTPTLKLKVKIGEDEEIIEGKVFHEATFISD